MNLLCLNEDTMRLKYHFLSLSPYMLTLCTVVMRQLFQSVRKIYILRPNPRHWMSRPTLYRIGEFGDLGKWRICKIWSIRRIWRIWNIWRIWSPYRNTKG